MTRYDAEAPVTLAPGMTRTSEEYRPRAVSDLGTPLVWSAVAGIALGGLVALFGESARVASTVGVVVFVVAFLATSAPVILAGPGIGHKFEEWVHLDLDGDGVVGTPEREYIPVTLDVVAGTRHRLLNVDITAAVRLFASRLLVDSVTFSEAGAGECGVDALAFRALRDQFIGRGLLAWKNVDNPRSGYVFRRGYHEVLRRIVDYASIQEER